MLALVDADSIYFRAVMSSLKRKEIRTIINTTMHEIMGQTFCTKDELMVAVKGHNNFRKELYPKYKANRPALKPEIRKGLNYAHNYMKEHWGAIESTGMEADDLVCIWAHEAMDMGEDYVIAGLDKDLLQIPGKHYNYKRGDHVTIDDDTAKYNMFMQCITGDTSDNIPGIKGYGPVKAARTLEHVRVDRYWNRVRALWRATRAGDPVLTRRLIEMLKSWEEYEDVKSQLPDQTSERKQDVREERKEDIQDSGLSRVSE